MNLKVRRFVCTIERVLFLGKDCRIDRNWGLPSLWSWYNVRDNLGTRIILNYSGSRTLISMDWNLFCIQGMWIISRKKEEIFMITHSMAARYLYERTC